jgi:hypothetical protein
MQPIATVDRGGLRSKSHDAAVYTFVIELETKRHRVSFHGPLIFSKYINELRKYIQLVFCSRRMLVTGVQTAFDFENWKTFLILSTGKRFFPAHY